MAYTLYSVTSEDGRTYYGQTYDTEKRWKKHREDRECVVGRMLDDSKCEFNVLENFNTREEARLTEALVIEMFPCVNKRGELTEVAIDKGEYGKLYRGYRDEVFNKKGKCRFCNLKMIDRNLNRHYTRCKILNHT